MDIEQFWGLINSSGQYVPEKQPQTLYTDLLKLTPLEVAKFNRYYNYCVDAAATGDIYGAGSLISDGPLSDDTFLYFRNWLVAQGRAVYEAALEEADSLASLPEFDELEAWDEDVAAVAYYVFEELTGKNNIYDVAPHLQCDTEGFDWLDHYEPDFLKEQFPTLWKLYGKRYKTPSDSTHRTTPWDKENVEYLVQQASPDDLSYIPIGISKHPTDCLWAETLCIQLCNHAHYKVRRMFRG